MTNWSLTYFYGICVLTLFRFQEGIGLEMKSGGALTSVKFDSIMSVSKFGM